MSDNCKNEVEIKAGLTMVVKKVDEKDGFTANK